MNSQDQELSGEISITPKGVGYFTLPGSEEKRGGKRRSPLSELEIQPHRVNRALNGDTVVVRKIKDKQFDRPQGEVVRIEKRAKTAFVGTVEKFRGKTVCVPDDRKFYSSIDLASSKIVPNLGDKVQVRITRWDEGKDPQGEIMEIIGRKGAHDTEMRSIVLEKGFATAFPEEVEQEATKVQKTEFPASNEEIAKRRDFRNTLTMTIDPLDAKDFDDALSFKVLPNGHYEIGVHIADVSHYVREGNALDREALKRGCSVYLVDRTIPMLPEILSNGICSLNPNEDRLTFSAVFEMDDHAKVYSTWIGKTIIHSNKRYTYEEAQNSIMTKTGEHEKELTILNNIAKKLSAERFRKGSIDFEKDEVKFELDKNGKPIRVYRKQRFDAHKLVEDFMLLANKAVAEFIHEENKKHDRKHGAFIYRIHDAPDPERILDLSIFIKALGFELESHDGKVSAKAIKRLLDSVTGTPHESLIKTAAIRSMAKAIYSTKNIGHFGLAFEHYAHFTSPIRRYPDLLVQRVLYKTLEKQAIGNHEYARYEKMAEHSTEQEIKAAEAERSSIKYKQVEYMQDKIGQIFEGTITGVTEWGIYIEENETKCEGMVKLRDLQDDYYVLNEKTYSLVGEKHKKTYTLGSVVKFKITGADLERKVLDYALVK